jgi:hypothetical protein
MVKGDVSFYVDTLLIETALGESGFHKTAQSGALSSLGDMVKNYFGAHYDENNKVNSVLDMLAPGAIYAIFRSLGFGKLGMLFGLAASVLHIDVAGMIESIYNSIRGTLSRGSPVAPAQLDSAVNQAIQEHTSDQAPEPPEQGQAFDKRNFDKEMREARIVRLALEQYDAQVFQLRKDAAPARSWFGGATRKATGSLIGRIIGWVFRLILVSAGFMVAGDLINKFLGRPNAIDRTYQAGQTSAPAASMSPATTQNKFPLNPSYQDVAAPHPWVVNVPNNTSSIASMLLGFAKDVYGGLDGKEAAIMSSPTFQAVQDQIAWYNHTSAGEPQVYIPTMYSSKKALVDHYIDEVSRSAGI